MSLSDESEGAKSAAPYRSILRSSMDGFWLLDRRGRVLEVNDAYCAMSGYSEAELLEMTVFELDADESGEETAAHIEDVIARGQDRFRTRHRRKDGAIIDVEVSAHFDPAGEGRFAVFIRDVTAQLAATRRLEALAEGERRSRARMETMLEGCQLIGFDWRYVYVNEAAARQGRYTRDELVGSSMVELYPGIEKTPLFAALERCMTERRSLRMDNRFVYPDGEVGWFELSIQPVPEGIFILSLDITERKRSERALLEADARLRDEKAFVDNLVAAMPDTVFVFEPTTGRAVRWNDAFRAVTGYSDEEIAALRAPDAYYGEADLALAAHAIEEILAAGRGTVQLDLVTKAGDIIPFEYSVSILAGEGDAAPLFISIGRDVRARRKLEDQLRQAQKMEAVGRLAGGVSHDFNNMLSVILGFTELAMAQVPADGDLGAYLGEVRAAATRSRDLTTQLLAFARKQTIAPVPLDLNAHIPGLLAMLERLIGEPISLLWRPGQGLWPVHVDPHQVHQALTNLVVNARDAIDGSGSVTIETRNATVDDTVDLPGLAHAAGDYVVLSVSDDGRGIEDADLPNIFDPFFTTKEVGEGTGLGLATVYGIVSQNGGFVHAYSEPGLGTTIAMYLPRHLAPEGEREAPRVRAEEEPAPPTGRGTVLVVEDEPALLRLTQRMFESLGYTVLAAASPGEALRRAAAHPGAIDLLLTDVIMPEMNGKELADAVLAARPDVVPLFMSGYPADVIAHHGVLDEGVHFIQKPFSLRVLSALVRAALDG